MTLYEVSNPNHFNMIATRHNDGQVPEFFLIGKAVLANIGRHSPIGPENLKHFMTMFLAKALNVPIEILLFL